MESSNEYCMILTTCSNYKEAESIATTLVENHLAACVQLIPIQSIYIWEDKLNKDNEVLLYIKTKTSDYQAVESHIVQNHSYDVPEIIQLPIQNGLPAYLEWIDQNTKATT
jgi:periplasmic divalent cation tolerance protein